MRRKVGLSLVFGAVLPLAAASVAWACGVLAVMTVDKKVVAPGEVVTINGKNWSTATGASEVTIRLGSRNGQIVTTTTAQPGGTISKTFPLPATLSPGWHVLIATQFNANGTPKTGTPGRTSVRVQGSSASGAVAAPWGSSTPGGSAGGGSLIVLLMAGALSLTMLAGGWKVLSRRGRTVSSPQLGV